MHEAEYPYIYRENATIYLDYLSKLIYNRYGNVKVDMLIAGGSAIILIPFQNCVADKGHI